MDFYLQMTTYQSMLIQDHVISEESLGAGLFDNLAVQVST